MCLTTYTRKTSVAEKDIICYKLLEVLYNPFRKKRLYLTPYCFQEFTPEQMRGKAPVVPQTKGSRMFDKNYRPHGKRQSYRVETGFLHMFTSLSMSMASSLTNLAGGLGAVDNWMYNNFHLIKSLEKRGLYDKCSGEPSDEWLIEKIVVVRCRIPKGTKYVEGWYSSVTSGTNSCAAREIYVEKKVFEIDTRDVNFWGVKHEVEDVAEKEADALRARVDKGKCLIFA